MRVCRRLPRPSVSVARFRAPPARPMSVMISRQVVSIWDSTSARAASTFLVATASSQVWCISAASIRRSCDLRSVACRMNPDSRPRSRLAISSRIGLRAIRQNVSWNRLSRTKNRSASPARAASNISSTIACAVAVDSGSSSPRPVRRRAARARFEHAPGPTACRPKRSHERPTPGFLDNHTLVREPSERLSDGDAAHPERTGDRPLDQMRSGRVDPRLDPAPQRVGHLVDHALGLMADSCCSCTL